jgi:hypothetical protein
MECASFRRRILPFKISSSIGCRFRTSLTVHPSIKSAAGVSQHDLPFHSLNVISVAHIRSVFRNLLIKVPYKPRVRKYAPAHGIDDNLFSVAIFVPNKFVDLFTHLAIQPVTFVVYLCRVEFVDAAWHALRIHGSSEIVRNISTNFNTPE